MRFSRSLILAGLVGAAIPTAFLVVRPDWALRVHRKLSGFRPSELSAYHHEKKGRQYASAKVIPEGSILLIGDSIVESVEPNLVHADAINYGISGDTTVGVLDRLRLYRFDRARAVLLAIGVNDFSYRDTPEILANIRRILEMIPSDMPVILSTVLPVVTEARPDFGSLNERIDRLNGGLRLIAGERSNVTIWNNVYMYRGSGANPKLFAEDGVHLNSEGIVIWSTDLRSALLAAGVR